MPDTKEILNNPMPTMDAPIPLVSTLPKVDPLTRNMLPETLSDYVYDVAQRTQCPPDYVASAILVVMATVIGNKYAIMPKQKDNWEVRINQWGALVGPPSAMKSPALKEAMRPVNALEQEEAMTWHEQQKRLKILAKLAKSDATGVNKRALELFQQGKEDEAVKLVKESEFNEEPKPMPRYIVNDATVEKLGELLNENPNGLLLFRDELAALIAKLSQEDNQVERAFYLECFDGNGNFTYDRIGRGTVMIKNCTLSVLGGIQPSKIAKVIRLAMNGHADDGLIQRLQLTVWPDPVGNWQWKDQAPNAEAYAGYSKLVRTFHDLPANENGEPTQLRFSPDAQRLFADWMEELYSDMKRKDYHPVIASHFAKSPKTIAALALQFELIEGGRIQVGENALLKALEWAPYLKSHALRMYSISASSSMDSAKLILKRRSKLKPVFTARDIRRKGWASLTESAEVNDAIDCLLEHNYLKEIHLLPGASGGRPTTQFAWNPAVRQND